MAFGGRNAISTIYNKQLISNSSGTCMCPLRGRVATLPLSTPGVRAPRRDARLELRGLEEVLH
eukprot:3547696-Heterocapsa_arctica.AAC.1